MNEILDLYPKGWFDLGPLEPNESDILGSNLLSDVLSAKDLISRAINSCFSLNSDEINKSNSSKSNFSNPLVIPLLFESTLLKNAKTKGAYYTPPQIAHLITSNCINEYLKIIESSKDDNKTADSGSLEKSIPKILDPACGGGIFLLSAYNILDAHLNDGNEKNHLLGNLNKIEVHLDLLSHLHGYDIDKNAINCAKIALFTSFLIKNSEFLNLYNPDVINSLKSKPKKKFQDGKDGISNYIDRAIKILNNNIRVLDPLLSLGKSLKNQNYQKNTLSFYAEAETLVNADYDIIITNPPYLNSKVLNSDYKKQLKGIFNTASSQMDLFSVFTELGYSLLKDGGILGYLIPDAFLGRINNSKLRNLLIVNTDIKNIFHISNIFEPQLANVILIAKKSIDMKRNANNGMFEFIEGHFEAESGNIIVKNKKDLSQRLFLKTPGYRIINIRPELLKILLEIRQQSDKIGNVFKIFRGEEIGKKNQILLKKSNRSGNQYHSDFYSEKDLPILTGGDIKRYLPIHSPESGLFIKANAVKKNINKYLQKKVMIRQLGRQINAAVDLSGKYITLQTVYNLLPVSESINLIALMVYLNSSFINYYYTIFYGEKLLFPRIIIADLKDLPLPTNFFEIAGDLEHIGKQIIKLIQTEKFPWEKIKSLQRHADEIILKSFQRVNPSISKMIREIF